MGQNLDQSLLEDTLQLYHETSAVLGQGRQFSAEGMYPILWSPSLAGVGVSVGTAGGSVGGGSAKLWRSSPSGSAVKWHWEHRCSPCSAGSAPGR